MATESVRLVAQTTLEHNANTSLSYCTHISVVGVQPQTLRSSREADLVRWWAAAAQWRNWPWLVKLAMVLLVPVVGGMVLGVLRVRSDVELANSYADIARIAEVRTELVPTLSAIQHERNLAMQQPTGRVSDFTEAAAE